MKLRLITAPDLFPSEHHLLNQLAMLDVEAIHLRKPKASAAEVSELVSGLSKRCLQKMVYHDYQNLADCFKFGAVHYQQQGQLAQEDCRSISCHSLREIDQLEGDFDNIFISPVFDSISKSAYQSGFCAEELKAFLQVNARREHICALGGIECDNIEQLAAMGFRNLAVLGAVWQLDKNPMNVIARVKELLLKIEIAKKEIVYEELA